MKRFRTCTVLCLSLFVGLLLMFPGVAASAEKKPYKIGVNLEITGPWANVTKTLRMAMDMELERVNAKGGVEGHPGRFVGQRVIGMNFGHPLAEKRFDHLDRRGITHVVGVLFESQAENRNGLVVELETGFGDGPVHKIDLLVFVDLV